MSPRSLRRTVIVPIVLAAATVRAARILRDRAVEKNRALYSDILEPTTRRVSSNHRDGASAR